MKEYDDQYISYYSRNSRTFRLKHKSTRAAAADIPEIMDIIGDLLKGYQTHYEVTADPKVIWMPHLFTRPKAGTKLRGSDDSIYEIVALIENPDTEEWDGLIQLDQEPNYNVRLRFFNDDYYIRFTHESARELSSYHAGTSEGKTPGRQIPPMKPTVAWSVAERMPAQFRTAKEVKERLRDSYHDPMYPGQMIEIYGQMFDNYIQFECVSRENYQAEGLVSWFEWFMRLHSWILQAKGAVNILFERRYRDEVVTKWRQDVASRSLRYLIRTDELFSTRVKSLTHLNISYEAVTGLDPEFDPRYIAGQYVTGDITSAQYRGYFQDLSGRYMFGDIYLRD